MRESESESERERGGGGNGKGLGAESAANLHHIEVSNSHYLFQFS